MTAPAQYIGNYGFIGLSVKETTFGTPVAATVYEPFESETFETDPGFQPVPTIKGTRAENNVSFGGEIHAAGGLVMPVGPINGGRLLAYALGTDTKTGAGPYTHTMVPNEAGIPSFTAEKNLGDPSGAGPASQQYAGCIVNKYGIEALTNAPLRATVDILPQIDAPLGSPSTASYTSDTPFSLANYQVTIFGTLNTNVIRIKLDVDNGGTAQFTFAGHRYSTLNYSGKRIITGEVEVILQSMGTNYSAAMAGTYGALILACTQGANSLTFTCPNIQWGKPQQPLKRGILITQVLPFTVFDIAGSSYDLQAVLVNTFATAYV